ncbi:MAG TPA: HAD-IA family hydrolase [Candidatus Binataceae bacterium]|jgi:putative hydrolase of the HAD superfamily
MLRVVFFDAAGTLIHTREPAGLSYAKIAERFGARVDERRVIDSFRRAFAAAPGLAFGPGHDAARLRELEREWWRRLVWATFEGLADFSDFDAYFDALFAFFADPANWVSDPEAPLLLAALRHSGIELGVISNFDYRIYAILDRLRLTRYLETITISSEAGYAKPAPEIFQIALERHGLSAAEALHVGDVEALDVAGARAADIAAILIDSDAVALESAPAAAVCRDSSTEAAAVEQRTPQFSQRAEPGSCGARCVRVRTLGEAATALGRFQFA